MSKFEKVLWESIEYNHCESFVAFEEEITLMVNTFMKSVLHSKWHATRNKFLFVYTEGNFDVNSEYYQAFYRDLTHILFIEIVNKTVYDLKTTKFVGRREDHPEQLVFLDRFFADRMVFQYNKNLYPDKLKNMQGRELISAVFVYEPFTILRENHPQSNVVDVGNGNKDPSKRYLYDGTDAQILIHLCWLYNCTLQVDTSEREEWGFVYDNLTSTGALRLVFERKADIAMMAMYMWYEDYIHLDMSRFLSRSGITCLVPAPRQVISWLLPLEPFQWLLWFGIAGCLFLETAGLLITRRADRSENVSWAESAQFGYVTSLKIFVSQGSDYLPSTVSVRIVLFSCYMIDIIITSIYSGGLASILTIPTLEEVADSLERLGKHKLIWSGTVYNWILAINGSDEDLIKSVLKNYRVFSSKEIKKNKKLSRSIGYVIERLEHGHFALPDYLDQDLIDHLKIMVDDIYYEYCVGFIQRSWAPLEKFNRLVGMMLSSGLTQYLEWKVVADHMNDNIQKQVESSVKVNFDDVGPMKLGIENFAGIVIILIIGTIISTLVFFGELLFLKYGKIMKQLP